MTTTPAPASPSTAPDAASNPRTALLDGSPFAHAAGGLRGFRSYTWWSLVFSIVMVLGIPIPQWVSTGPFPLWLDVTRGVATIVAAVGCIALVQHLVPRTGPLDPLDSSSPPLSSRLAAVGGAVVVAVCMLIAGDLLFWAGAPAMATALLSVALPARRRRDLLVAVAAVAAVVSLLVGLTPPGDPFPFATVFTVGLVLFVYFMKLAQLWIWDVAARLDVARQVEGELAVADERLRFAADLHDIQGHSLQVIALKSELAARLAEVDTARAAAQMREVQELAADALRDTRAVVQGYRRTTLDAEVANATGVLAAASIDGRMRLDEDVDTSSLHPEGRHLLGLVVREATTNILRHSDARRAEFALGEVSGELRLTISNDGAYPQRDPGGGLSGLRDRLEQLGGALTWDQQDDRFQLTATVPAGREPAAPEPSGPGPTALGAPQ